MGSIVTNRSYLARLSIGLSDLNDWTSSKAVHRPADCELTLSSQPAGRWGLTGLDWQEVCLYNI